MRPPRSVSSGRTPSAPPTHLGRAPDPASAAQVLERVDVDQHRDALAGRREPRRDLVHVRPRVEQALHALRQEHGAGRDREPVEHGHPAAGLRRVGRDPGRLARRGHLRRHGKDEDVGEAGQLLVRGGVRAGRRRRRRRMRAAGAQAVVERRRVDVDPVPELLVAEADGERHRAPGRLLGGGIGHVGRRVEHDRGVLGGHARVARTASREGGQVPLAGQPPLALLRLDVHVGDGDPVDRAHDHGGRDGRARVVGVDVHLDERRLADHEEAVAHREQGLLEALAVDPVPLDEKRRAVAVSRLLEVHRLEADRARDGVDRCLDLLAAEPGERAARELEQAGGPGVDDAGVAQHVEHPLRADDRRLALGQDRRHGLLERPVGDPLRRLGHLADDGEHGALDRLLHGLVGRVGRGAKRLGERLRVDAPGGSDDPGEAADDLAQDGAGVPAGPAERGPGRRHGQRRPRVGRVGLEPDRELAGGLGQVRARVAVGDRVDVQIVQAPAARLDRGSAPPRHREGDAAGLRHGVRLTPWMWIWSD